jgi:hypothetical protein
MNRHLFKHHRLKESAILLFVLAFLGVIALGCKLGSNRAGEQKKPSVWQIEQGVFAAGVPTNEFEFFAAPETAGHQRQSNWCWAACVQMVLNYHGIKVTQEQVVERIFRGSEPNLPGQPNQILEALSGWALTRNGERVNISSSPFALDGSEIVKDLAGRWPIVVGVRMAPNSGHAFVLTAVTYRVDSANQPIFLTAVLRDPWPSNQSRVEVPWNVFQQNWMFMARVRVSPA